MFVTDLSCISPQRTFDDAFFENDIKFHAGNRYAALEPVYGSLIPAGLLRRMGKAVRMGVGAGLPLIQRRPDLDGIILGTANGGLEDCLKFLNQIVDYEEGTLTPTNFVQSTPNAIAGNLALMSKNTGYNTTHVHKGLAFECALLDCMLLFEERKAESLLLGGVEEISEYNYNIDFLSGSFKRQNTTSENLLSSDSPGTVCGEGAAFFVVEAERSAKTIAQIKDTDQISYPSKEELFSKMNHFLDRNGIAAKEIDVVILGYSGDNRNDGWYDQIHQEFFLHSSVYTYKNLVGDYPSVSAFATWLAVQLLSGKPIPARLLISNLSDIQNPKNILIYNHHKGVQHGFILLTI
ncbi:beta-ketoacyl synthase chain length factor [Dyadobacter sp. NIV53]|uniref:beta-ketoacyl synthase chain length factor n=1 Tax=Dyadobacter sp. NIV53 TaxID=2861765 RepID=UPI001C86AC63|nr:beta-ketoacyl synthase chain length factor [Dyadobacter sp. NIV53]